MLPQHQHNVGPSSNRYATHPGKYKSLHQCLAFVCSMPCACVIGQGFIWPRFILPIYFVVFSGLDDRDRPGLSVRGDLILILIVRSAASTDPDRASRLIPAPTHHPPPPPRSIENTRYSPDSGLMYRSSVADAEPTLNQHQVNVSYYLLDRLVVLDV